MYPDYSTLKAVHVTCAAASYGLFFARGLFLLRDAAALRARWARLAPHVVDTVLLASAIAMSVASAQYPFVAAWLTAKLLALLAYIGLGMLALHWGRTPRVRIAAWVAAQAVFLYIVAVALARDPAPWRAWG
ncbi:MAG: SirB2 family protein [Burkholderiales bacterium]|nr:SirB2 family protein [Burkholderiales bacterium]